jgi:hypothetical protein
MSLSSRTSIKFTRSALTLSRKSGCFAERQRQWYAETKTAAASMRNYRQTHLDEIAEQARQRRENDLDRRRISMHIARNTTRTTNTNSSRIMPA